MSIIIPYESSIYLHGGSFIKPNGEVLHATFGHERFADEYCNGPKYHFLWDIIHGQSYYSTRFDEFKKNYNFNGDISDIDVFSSTKLNPKQLELYKLWLERNLFEGDLSDFLVFVLGFDKVEPIIKKTITTTSSQPHIRFYNYYLMDWKIEEEVPLSFNLQTNKFEYITRVNWAMEAAEDREAADEINEIKAKILIKDRPWFFKQ